MELLEEVGEPDIVLVCCGGGGLLSGIATALKLSSCANCKIYGVEPYGCEYFSSVATLPSLPKCIACIFAVPESGILSNFRPLII